MSGQYQPNVIRGIIRKYWLEEYYGPFPVEKSTEQLVEMMMIDNGKEHGAFALAQGAIRRRDTRIRNLSLAVAYLLTVGEVDEQDPAWLKILFLLDPRDVHVVHPTGSLFE